MTERKIFGTDGVRDVANSGLMTPEAALSLGRAYVKATGSRRIVVGRDTRLSGQMLEGALVSGMSSEGAEVYLAGIIPTPGVSYSVQALGADGGAVISASHNPAEYNGIKFLGSDGCKLSDTDELAVEAMLYEPANSSPDIGAVHDMPVLVREYALHIAGMLSPDAVISGIAFDCAAGAASETVPILCGETLFSGMNSHIICSGYDGRNINKDCGVMHMDNITGYVTTHALALGFAFDGDADRVLISDKYGRVIDGDIILWVLGRWQKAVSGNDKVVATVMSNMALEKHLSDEGIRTIRCPVGDRYVLESMRKSGAGLGGEQSGHIIAFPFTGTGDGLCTAVLFLNALKYLKEDPSELVDKFGRYPQRLTSIKLNSPREELDMTAVNRIVSLYTWQVAGGRIYVRKSGTEPLLRILVEGPESTAVAGVSEELTSRLKVFLGEC